MPSALTPALALEYLRALSADVLAGAVLADDGTPLAGAPDVAAAARALLGAAPAADEVEVLLPEGRVFAARSATHAIAVACGPHALPALARQDLRAWLGDLAGAGEGAA